MNSPTADTPTLQVFSRPGCHLCERLLDDLLPLVRGRFRVEVLDVDSRADWRDAHGMHIPVLCHAGREICRHVLDRQALQRVLDADSPVDQAS